MKNKHWVLVMVVIIIALIYQGEVIHTQSSSLKYYRRTAVIKANPIDWDYITSDTIMDAEKHQVAVTSTIVSVYDSKDWSDEDYKSFYSPHPSTD